MPARIGKDASGALAFSANSQQLIVGATTGQIDVVSSPVRQWCQNKNVAAQIRQSRTVFLVRVVTAG
jgi:hypothetical protein